MNTNSSSEKIGSHWLTMKSEYKLLCKIGQGSFGEVVHAQHIQTKKHCAIKFIKYDENDLA